MSISLSAELHDHVDRHGPITIGLAGAGQMGTDIVVQVALMYGLRIGARLRAAAAWSHVRPPSWRAMPKTTSSRRAMPQR